MGVCIFFASAVVPSGVFLGCKTRVQDFCSLQKIFSHPAKIFEAYLKNFSKSFRYEMFCEKEMSLDIGGKNFKAAKILTHHAKIFA